MGYYREVIGLELGVEGIMDGFKVRGRVDWGITSWGIVDWMVDWVGLEGIAGLLSTRVGF